MSSNLPATIPSLARAFETEREALRATISEDGLSSQKAVVAARQTLDRTGERFAASTEDMQLQKSGLWLLEMVKSGAGVLDRGASADIIWREVPRPPSRIWAGRTLFYGAAGAFMLAGFVQGSRLTMLAALVMALLRFFDPKDWKHFLAKIPFIGRKKTPLLEAPGGQAFLADAHINVEAGGYVDALAESLRTADHVLLRLAEPARETLWSDDERLIGLVQGLLEAGAAGDGGFALKLVETELAGLLRSDDIEIVDYSSKTAKYFDVLPALDMDARGTQQAAPALLKDGALLRRGTVWKA